MRLAGYVLMVQVQMIETHPSPWRSIFPAVPRRLVADRIEVWAVPEGGTGPGDKLMDTNYRSLPIEGVLGALDPS
jgi:hypothetical protein